jgi:phosphopantetheine--protein transferase-like protein
MLDQDWFSNFEIPNCPAMARVSNSPFQREHFERWKSWLREDELRRASTYRRQADQELFVARRGVARESIAQMRGILPNSIRFIVAASGKLQWSSDDLDRQPCVSFRELDFSIAKTSGLVAMAACESVRIGVDIETIGPLPELEIMAMQNLHPTELQIWNEIPQRDRTLAYYQSWIVKEAFVKALGTGLNHPPNSIVSAQALSGSAQGTVQLLNLTSPTCHGHFWMAPIGKTGRIAIVIL